MSRSNGSWYIYRKPCTLSKRHPSRNVNKVKEWFRATATGKTKLQVSLGTCMVPEELFGKRFRLKVELVDEDDKNEDN